ncbi:MAG TPA: hypothetical protein VFA02_05910 [Pseudacidobacterium sp.]|nr:hypothetical protein [Pseudacidobacterium sp.]
MAKVILLWYGFHSGMVAIPPSRDTEVTVPEEQLAIRQMARLKMVQMNYFSGHWHKGRKIDA